MEKWKIATFVGLFVAFLGFGIAQQNSDKQALVKSAAPTEIPPSAVYLGKTPPAWNFKQWNGAPVSLASLRGKPAFVEMFRIECPHCQAATPFLVALEKRYAPRGLKSVAIQSPGNYTDPTNPENSWPKVQAWMKENRVNYPVAFDEGSQYFQGAVLKQMLDGDTKKLLYPTMWLLDPTGKINWVQSGYNTEKAISLAVEMERRFPTKTTGASAPRENGADLAKWLIAQLPEVKADPAMSKALGDDIGMRLFRGK